MDPSTVAVWLDAWERGMSVPPVRRPVVVLEAWHGAEAQPGAWPLGQREAALLRLRTALFGGAMESLAQCPQCGGCVEFTLHADELLRAAPAVPAERVTVEAPGASATFRLPHTGDLEAVAAVPASHRPQFLLQRCLTAGELPGAEVPDEFLTAAAESMAEADPLGDVSVRLDCPDCRHGWAAPFDAGEFLWMELQAWAARIMSEVQVLAAAYGWTEPEVLALPTHRRRFYLERTLRPA
jgi:hypothetical protein